MSAAFRRFAGFEVMLEPWLNRFCRRAAQEIVRVGPGQC